MSDHFAEDTNAEQGERLAWNRPTVTTFDVLNSTEGGVANYNSPGDDIWYVS